MGVDPGGWDEFRESVVVYADFPGGVVDDAVVAAAQQDEIVEVGGAAVGPVSDVVGVGPAGGVGAAGVGAALVAGGQGFALVDGDQSAAASDVQGFGSAIQDHGDEVAVAGEAAYG